MKGRLSLLLALVALIALIGAIWFFRRIDDISTGPASVANNPPGTQAAASESTRPAGATTIPASDGKVEGTSEHVLKIQWARGSGYALGNQIKEIYNRATVDDDGAKHLDLTALKEDFTSGKRLVAVEDAFTPADVRAEYMAAVLAAALDQPVSKQRELVGPLLRFYETDTKNHADSAKIDPADRVRLSDAARNSLVSVLPIETQARFREVTAAEQFLFLGASFRSDRISFRQGSSGMDAQGSVTVGFSSGKGINITADRFQAKHKDVTVESGPAAVIQNAK
jgi:hypothetical protein